MRSKDEIAREIAEDHYAIDSAVTKVYRLVGTQEAESRADEPIKILEVNEATVPAGILPLGFGAVPERGWDFPLIVVDVTPEEFEGIRDGRLPLPNGWQIAELLPKPAVLESVQT